MQILGYSFDFQQWHAQWERITIKMASTVRCVAKVVIRTRKVRAVAKSMTKENQRVLWELLREKTALVVWTANEISKAFLKQIIDSLPLAVVDMTVSVGQQNLFLPKKMLPLASSSEL